ncbi:MAG: DNA gyrase inhibitor YacG [Aeromonas sp.]
MSNTQPTLTTVPCPTCKTEVVWGAQSPFRPFCSKRCQLIDLGEWADEEKRIAGDNQPPHLPDNFAD